MKILPDGSIISTHTPNKKIKRSDNKDFGIYKAIVTKTHYADSPSNTSPFMVTYEVEFIEGFMTGLKKLCVEDSTSNITGPFNFLETVKTPAQKSVTNLELSKKDYKGEVGMGDVVLIAFRKGDINNPIIVGCIPHRLFGNAAKIEDGIRLLGEFNGIRWNINKDGEIIITYYGGQRKLPKDNIFKTQRPNTAPTQIKIDKEGSFSLEDKENQLFKMDRLNKKLILSQGSKIKANEGEGSSEESKIINSIELDKQNKKITTLIRDPEADENIINQVMDGTAAKFTTIVGKENEITQELDGTAEKTTLTFKSGLIVTVDGAGDKVEITTSGGAKLKIDGGGDSIEAEDSVGGKLKISAGKVGLGASSAELLDLFEQCLTQIEILTVTGNLGYPTSVPNNVSAFTIIKTQLNGIKGTL